MKRVELASLIFMLLLITGEIIAQPKSNSKIKTYQVYSYVWGSNDSTLIYRVTYDNTGKITTKEGERTMHSYYSILEDYDIGSDLEDIANKNIKTDHFEIKKLPDGAVRCKSYYWDEDFENPMFTIETFNKDQQMIDRISTDWRICEAGGRSAYNHYTYEYDKSGNIIHLKHYDKEFMKGNEAPFYFRAEYFFAYDKRKNVTEKQIVYSDFSSERTRYRYDNNNRIIWAEFYGYDSKYTRFFTSYYE